ncbi:MAG: hypothetical protein WB699_18140 [Bacteroidota bacterium]
MKKHLKNIASILILLLVGLTVGVLASEAIVRRVAPQRLDSFRPIYDPDPYLVYKLKKHYHATYSQPEFQIVETTNSIGIRDHEVGPKIAGGVRILGLGDSFSYSNSVNLENTFFKQIERSLSSSTPVEVLDAAVPAYSTIQELRYLEKYGVNLDPDIVLLGFYVGNDFQDSWELFDTTGVPTVDVVNGVLRANDRFPGAMYEKQERPFRTATAGLRSMLASNSELYVFLRERFSETLWRLGLRNNPPPADFCAKSFSPEMQKGWALEQKLLLEFKNFTTSHHERFILLALPTQYQVHEELWHHHFTTFHLDPDKYDLEKPQKMLSEYCRRNGIEYIDVLPAMRDAGKRESLFYPIASYMNPNGHRLVGTIVSEYLRQHP